MNWRHFICPPCVRGCVRIRTICLPIHLSPNSFVSQVLVSQFIPQTAYCWGTQFYLKMCPPCVRGCVRLPGLCVSHPLSPMSCVRGCVRLPGLCVSHQFPNSLLLAFSILFQAVSGYVQMVVSGSPDVPNSFVPLWQFICLPIWLVVSGFGCLQFICLALWQLICLSPMQSGWWCPALRLSQSRW